MRFKNIANHMSSEMFELTITLILVAILLIIGLGWSRISGYISCESYENITDRSTKYSLITGCYVKNDSGRWVPKEEMTKSSVVESK